MASTIHNIMPKIVLSSENLSELSKSTNLENVIKMALFHNANESFQALASLISFGTSSPSKKSRKALRSDLFGKIAYETFPIKNHGNIKLSHMEIATGLQSLSDRWARYSFDELLSLVMLIDVNGKGSLSVDDFVVFTDLVDGVVNKVGPHEEQLGKLYDSLKTKLLLTSADGKVSMKVREKIVVLGNEARYLHQTPLTMLCAALEENGSHSANELLVEFVESLAAFVAAQRDALGVQQEKGKAAQSDAEEQEEANDEVEAEGAIEIDDSTFVNVDEDEEQEELGDNNSRSGDSGIDSGSDSEEEGVAEFNESDVDFSSQAQSQADFVVEQDISITANNAPPKERSAASTHTAETPSTPHNSGNAQQASTTDDPTTLRNTKPSENESAAAQGSQPLDASPQAKEALLRTLDAFQTNAQLISANLSSYDRRLQSSEDMWAQLQQMERDLRAAQDLFKRVVRRPTGDNDTTEVVATSHPSHTHYGSVGEATAAGDNHSARVASNVATEHHDVHHRHSHTTSSGHPNSHSSDHNHSRSHDHSSLRTPMIKTKSSGNLLYTPEPTNISSINNHLNDSGIMVSGAVGGRSVSPSGVHSFSSSTGGRFFTPASEDQQTPQMRHSAEVLAVKSLQNSYKNKVNLTVNVRPGAKAASDKPSEARINQFTAPPVRTDLSIFKSPIKRQAHGNRNVSKAGEGWQRTAQLTNKYNERFQTCADLRFASKVNAVFYNPK